MPATLTGLIAMAGSVVATPSGGDDTGALSALMDQANTQGKALFLAPGTYTSGLISKSYAPRIWAIPGTVTILSGLAAGAGGWLWTFAGSIAAQVNLSTDVTRNTNVIPVASTTGFAADDLLLLGDNTTPFATDSLRYRGQIVAISSVDSATQITSIENAYQTISAASSGGIQKITPIVDVSITGLKFVSNDATNVGGFLDIEKARNVLVDVACEGHGGASVALKNVYRFNVKARTKNGYDNAVTGLQQFGYGVGISQASTHGIVEVQTRKARHAVAILGDDNFRGEPYDIIVRGSASGCTSAAFDAHGEGQGITFDNVRASSCANFGIQVRCREVTINGGQITNCAGGVHLFDNWGDVDINGLTVNTVKSIDGTTSQGYGIFADVAGTGLRVKGTTFQNIGRDGIAFTVACTDVDIVANTFKNCGTENVSGHKNAIVWNAGGTRNYVHDNAWFAGTNDLNFLGPTGTFTDSRAWNNAIPTGKTLTTASASFKLGPNLAGAGGQLSRNRLTVTFSTTPTFDASLAEQQEMTLTANVTSSTLSNGSSGQELELTLIQDSTGSRTFVWPANVKLAGGALALTTTASKRDVVVLRYDGTNWYERSRALSQ